MQFTKMHGLGNDFVMFDDRDERLNNLSALAKRVCDRRTGVGADGIILVRGSKAADVRMLIYNSDGSEAEMCGNGIRCFAKYVFDRHIVPLRRFYVETLAGVMDIALTEENGLASSVTVGMGTPEFAREKIPMLGMGDCLEQKLAVLGREFTFSSVLLGVPHTVVFVNDLDTLDIAAYGAAIETHSLFPRKTNVNFAEVLDRQNIKVRTWERGCGATLACGTGSSSVVVLSALAGHTERTANVHLALGTLSIEWKRDGAVFMTGPAALAFEGDIAL